MDLIPMEDGAMPDTPTNWLKLVVDEADQRMTILPRHPATGLRAVGIVSGRPVWPILGASTDDPHPSVPTPPPVPAAPVPPPPAASTSEPVKPAEDPMDTDGGRRALAAERQRAGAEKKRADDLAARLQEIEDKDKSDLERATTRVAELEKSYADEQRQRLRLQVATSHNISADDLVLLTGGSEEELNAQAGRIVALSAARAAATAPPTFAPNPAQQAGNGASPPPKPSVNAGRDLYRARRGGTKATTK